MNFISKIRSILSDNRFDLADKICEIEKALPIKKGVGVVEFLGSSCTITKEGNAIIIDGSAGFEYIDNPRLENRDDLYYEGCGCTWGIDLDGNRYWKRYSPFMGRNSNDRYAHLSFGDIIDEKARMKKLIIECLNEL